jgi:hypothetical protein
MVPNDYVLLDALPLLPSEKINRAALSSPPQWYQKTPPTAAASAKASGFCAGSRECNSSSTASGIYSIASSSSTASGGGGDDPQCLKDIVSLAHTVWGEVLGVPLECISTISDFFALGGSSLTVGIMNSRLRTALKLPNMSGLLAYRHPVLRDFAGAVFAVCKEAAAAENNTRAASKGARGANGANEAATGVFGTPAAGHAECLINTSSKGPSSPNDPKGDVGRGKDKGGAGSKGPARDGTDAEASLAFATAEQYVGASLGIAGE